MKYRQLLNALSDEAEINYWKFEDHRKEISSIESMIEELERNEKCTRLNSSTRRTKQS